MPQTGVIQLTTAGSGTGLYNIYSDVDLYTTPFETTKSRVDLLAGYTSSLIPDNTSNIAIKSNYICKNIEVVPVLYPITVEYQGYYYGSWEVEVKLTNGSSYPNETFSVSPDALGHYIETKYSEGPLGISTLHDIVCSITKFDNSGIINQMVQMYIEINGVEHPERYEDFFLGADYHLPVYIDVGASTMPHLGVKVILIER